MRSGEHARIVPIGHSGAAVTAERLVVIGGGPAALEAARAYREAGADGEVVLVSGDEYLPYNRPPLSKDFLRGESEEDALPLEDGDFYRHHAIEVRLRTRAQALDTVRRVVTLSDGRDPRLRLVHPGHRGLSEAATGPGR